MSLRILNEQQIENFLHNGHITLHGCFEPQAAREWIDMGWQRLGYDPKNPATWEEKRVHQAATERVKIRDFAPDAFAAICDLCGGEERIGEPSWSNGFIWNLGIGADQPWQSPQEREVGWHKDGDFFRHFLDSPEQALLTIVLWDDIEPRGGGTFVACDSVPIVAKFLAEHPEGVMPGEFPFRAMKNECQVFIEASGQAGDVILMHPYILHAASQNVRGKARIISNPPVHLQEPMNFNRPDGNYSPVERAVLRGLGVENLDFQPQAPREKIVPKRIQIQEQRRREEAARLAGEPSR